MNNYKEIGLKSVKKGMVLERDSNAPSFSGGMKVFHFLTSRESFKVNDIRIGKKETIPYGIISTHRGESLFIEVMMEGLDVWIPLLAFGYNRKLRLKNYLDFIEEDL
jgi:hypothetical protein